MIICRKKKESESVYALFYSGHPGRTDLFTFFQAQELTYYNLEATVMKKIIIIMNVADIVPP
jgi:hypothetical protein